MMGMTALDRDLSQARATLAGVAAHSSATSMTTCAIFRFAGCTHEPDNPDR